MHIFEADSCEGTFPFILRGTPIRENNNLFKRYLFFFQVHQVFFPESDLSYDVASGSEITPCNKICKPLVVYRISGNVMTSITMLRTAIKIWLDVRYSTFNIQILNVEYRISNSISHSNFECRISNIKLNPTFKSNVEYRISN